MQRRSGLKLTRAYYQLIQGEYCVYCGDIATTKDHFLPVTFVAKLLALDLVVPTSPILPCCLNCNVLAGGKVFKTIGAKRRHIQTRIREKYKGYLDCPNWTEEEINALGFTLGSKIRKDMDTKLWLRERLEYVSSFRSVRARTKPVRENSIRTGNGNSTAQIHAEKPTMPMTEQLRLISFVRGGLRSISETEIFKLRSYLHQKRCKICGGLYISEFDTPHCEGLKCVTCDEEFIPKDPEQLCCSMMCDNARVQEQKRIDTRY